MNRFAKTVLVALMLMAMPLVQWAQEARSHIIEIELSEITNPDYRFCLLSAIAQDHNLSYIIDDENNSVLLSSADDWADRQFQTYYEELESIAGKEFEAYLRADKDTQGETFSTWKDQLPKDLFALLFRLMLMEDPGFRDGNQTCATSEPFCTTDVVTFNVAANPGGYCESGPYYGCLSNYTDRPPFWFHMKIGVAGAFQIKMSNSSNVDIDFCCWGPFDDPVTPCPNQLSSEKYVSCGASSAHTEYCNIPSSSQVGKYYIMVITKYNQSTATNITFQKVTGSGPGETDCGILPGIATNDGPYCVGQTIQLHVNEQEGASYSWTGPGGFTSNQQNPTRPNCTMNMAGTYTCVTTIDNHSVTATTEVEIFAQPTANFNFTSVCKGEATQFTSTSSTNPTGQTMSYLWDFGDGQTSTQQNPSHTYAQAGNFNVSLTVSCGNGLCSDTKTQSVTVNANPVANAGPDGYCNYGQPYQLSGSGGAGTFSFHWEPADKVINPDAQNTLTVPLVAEQTFTLTVINTQGQCTDTDQVNVLISGSAMAVMASPDISICQGGSGEIYVAAGGGTGNYTYSWTPTTGLSNPNIANPIASPVQTTTYTCTVNDGATSQTVSVKVTVNDIIIEHEYATICPNDTFIWNGASYSAAGTYQHDTVTDQGCDKTIFLHLDHHPVYDETLITAAICSGESYNFYGTNYDYSCQVSYTDQTIHGCDSIVRLNLTVYEDNGVTLKDISICPEQLPYSFYGVDYYDEADVTVWDTDIHGCDSAVRLVLSVSDYYKPEVQTVYKCYTDAPSFDWNPVGNYHFTLTEPGFYIDTLPTSACDGIFRLDLHFKQVPEVQHDTVVACDSYYWEISGQTYTSSGEYYHSLPIYDLPSNPSTLYPCTEDHLLHLTVNKSNTTAERTFSNQCDSIPFNWFGETHYLKFNGTYPFSGETTLGCDSAMLVTVENMKYTPMPCAIAPSDLGESGAICLNDSTYAVITNTEFFSFNYDFYVNETGLARWLGCEWSISHPSWKIDQRFDAQTNSGFCKVHVGQHYNEPVVLTAKAKSDCSEIVRNIYLVSTFFDVEENGHAPAGVTIVPNPSNGHLRLNFKNMEGRISIKVFDMRGNRIDDFVVQAIRDGSYDYDMKRHAEGIYLFVVTDDTLTLTLKAVIIH